MGRRPRTKDPNAPKAAASAQQLFAKSRRDAVKKAKPELSSADLQKAISDEWRVLPQNKRAPFVNAASKDKARFAKESETYVPDPSMLKPTKGGKRLQKDPLRPKKPRSAYLYFGEATRAELASANPGIRIETLSKLIGEEWRKLSDAAKAPYNKLAEKDQERYKKQMESYEPSAAYLAAREAFKANKKKKAAKAAAGEGDATDDEGEDFAEEREALTKENTDLKKQVAKLEKELEKASAKVEKLTEKLTAAGNKRKAEKEAAKEKPAKKAKAEKAEKPAKASKADGGEQAGSKKEKPIVVADEAHFEKWTKKVLGAKGQKADDDLKSALEVNGAAGVVKLLAKRYKAEHK